MIILKVLRNHQVKNGSMFGLISTAEEVPESGYSSKFDTSPRLLTVGTYVALIFFFKRSSQLKLLNQRCFLMSFAPKLLIFYHLSDYRIVLISLQPVNASLKILRLYRKLKEKKFFLSKCFCRCP